MLFRCPHCGLESEEPAGQPDHRCPQCLRDGRGVEMRETNPAQELAFGSALEDARQRVGGLSRDQHGGE
jgi:tRNA(Ile2) C34 agmatinyltransferase TiaS